MTAEAHDTAGLLGIMGGDWAGFASVGAALRHVMPSQITLELFPVGKIGDAERLAVKYIFGLSLSLSFLILALGAWHHFQCFIKTRTLRSFAPQPDIEAVFKGKSSTEIEVMIAAMQEQSTGLPDLAGGARIRVVPVLKAIVDALPEKVWLTKIVINNPIKTNISSPLEFRLVGHSMGASVGDEQQKAQDFKANLSLSPVLNKIFDDINIKIDRQDQTADGAGGAGQSEREAYKRKLEQRTMLDVIMKVRKKT